MRRLFSITAVIMILAMMPTCLKAAEPIRHELKIVLYPQEKRFVAEDTITFTERLAPDLQFVLHKGLQPYSSTPNVRVVPSSDRIDADFLDSFRAILPPGQNSFVLKYGGIIHHPLESYGKEQARGFKQTRGVISTKGVYLSAGSFWYPIFDKRLVTFTLQVELPLKWNAVSQGERTQHVRKKNTTLVKWESPQVQEEIYLIAAPFTEYTRPAGSVTTMVFLRKPDENLAGKYLDAAARYLEMYATLIGPYPYEKFALVENFWETGYGMASFTLLGPRIIRFPFILHSSYPHEILHNWWGNSIFPDYEKGNWSEGLTAYLSDHLIKEMRGDAASHRQEVLQKYADYVLEGRDFPLVQFRSRHSTSTEAIGYGKSLMFFHMLRQKLSDDVFIKGLRDFYRNNRFRMATFEDLRTSFENVSGKNLSIEFDQWTVRSGAPALAVSDPQAVPDGAGWILNARLEQVQPEHVYLLRIPVAVTIKGQSLAYQTVVVMDKKRVDLRLRLPGRPVRMDVDPEFDLFRRLDRDEIPPALTQAFGAKKMLILLPSSTDKKMIEAYGNLANALAQSGPDEVTVSLDNEIKTLPEDRAVILCGWENRFRQVVASALSGYDVRINQENVSIGLTNIPRKGHSVVLSARQPNNKDVSLAWIASDLPQALPGLGRKLPHYHKYSYLGFQGQEPANIAKGRWPVVDSPMTAFVPGMNDTVEKVERGKLAPRKPLTNLAPVFSKKQMMDTVRFLASDKLRGRGLGSAELDSAAEFIAEKFQKAGLTPAEDATGSYFQIWTEQTGDPERKMTLRNVVGIIPGKDQTLNGQSVVVGAHYDHLGLGWPDVRKENKGKIHAGADDNASGVAVLIELASVLGRSLNPDRRVVFIAFTGEEAGRIGSRHYVSPRNGFSADQCIGMLNLDTVGRLEKNKLIVLGAGSAKEWVHILRGAGYVSGVDVEVVSEELDSSDQKSFQEAGIPAVQLFSGPHEDYHRPTDTADKIDSDGLIKVATISKEIIAYLAERKESMTTIKTSDQNSQTSSKSGRRVSLGTIPDFAYQGDGFQLSGVVPGSPAEKSGLKQGDVIIRIGSDDVHSLKGFADILKSLNPGDRISITFLRQGKEMSVYAELEER